MKTKFDKAIDPYLNSISILINERVEKSDIIDLYIIMSMPALSDPALQYTANDIFKRKFRNVQDEIQSIILRELRHLHACSTFDNIIETYKLLKPRSSQKKIGSIEAMYAWADKNIGITNSAKKKIAKKKTPYQLSPIQILGHTKEIAVGLSKVYGRQVSNMKLKELSYYVKELIKIEKFLKAQYGNEDSRKYNTNEVLHLICKKSASSS